VRWLRIGMLTLGLGATSVTATAQGAGVITGTVRDPYGRPIPHAEVRVDGAAQASTADSLGRFSLQNVPPGTVMLRVLWICYRRLGPRAVRVGADSTTHVDLVLQPRTARELAPTARACLKATAPLRTQSP
jgi:hypothetical protein